MGAVAGAPRSQSRKDPAGKPLARVVSSAQAILPADVTLDHLNAYQDAILKDRLRAEPEKRTWHKLAAVWNACRREVDGWPDVKIPWVSRRQAYTLAVVGVRPPR